MNAAMLIRILWKGTALSIASILACNLITALVKSNEIKPTGVNYLKPAYAEIQKIPISIQAPRTKPIQSIQLPITPMPIQNKSVQEPIGSYARINGELVELKPSKNYAEINGKAFFMPAK